MSVLCDLLELLLLPLLMRGGGKDQQKHLGLVHLNLFIGVAIWRWGGQGWVSGFI
jgi:hypothetical protein